MKFTFSLIFLVFSFCITTTSLFSQDKIYFDEDWDKCSLEYASYYRIVTKTKNGFVVEDHYLNGDIQMNGLFADKKCTISDGKFEYFDSTGAITKSCTYMKNRRTGAYLEYYPNGQIMIKDYIENNERTGLYAEFYIDGSQRATANFSDGDLYGSSYRFHENKSVALIMEIDSLGTGNFKSFYSTGEKKEEGKLINGYKIGPWTYYNEEGQILKEEDKNEEVDLRKRHNEINGLKPETPLP